MIRTVSLAAPGPWRRFWLTGAVYLVAYVALDWVSFAYEFSRLGITPWNPPPGLSIVLLIRGGLGYAPWLFLASLAADIVVRGVFSWAQIAASATIAMLGYTAAAFALVNLARIDARLARLRDAAFFILTTAAASIIVAVLQIATYVGSGQLAPEDIIPASLRFWVGDLSGILVLSPLLLRFSDAGWHRRLARLRHIDLETALQILGLGSALWIVFGLESTDEFKFFYLLLLPMFWIALRHGTDGACLASVGAQIGLFLLVGFRGFDAATVTEFQILTLILAATGLMIGAGASERQASARALRRHQAELAHFSRVSLAGEMASALAHELSQPLAAIATYLAACQRFLRGPAADDAKLAESLDKAAAQAQRANQVLSRLRNFLYRGETTLTRIPVQAIARDAASLVASEAAAHKVAVVLDLEPAPAPVVVDNVQMQQVVLNLVRNAIEAISEADSPERRIEITQRARPETVEITVHDSGPGLSPEIAGRLFDPFVTTKGKGMGLGLAISRSIVQSHGGNLSFEPAKNGGARFVITLPRADDGA